MKLQEIREEFIKNMKECDYDKEMIDFLADDMATMLWVEHCLTDKAITYRSMRYLFGDAGFHEGLQLQYDNPMNAETMLLTINGKR